MIVLKSFAEEVPVEDLNTVQRFLVFESSNDGRQLRVPISEDGIRAVASFMRPTAQSTSPTEEVPTIEESYEQSYPSDERIEGAQVFGEEDTSMESDSESMDQAPATEDDIPSL